MGFEEDGKITNSDTNILIDKAYIDELTVNIDVLDKLKEYYDQAKNFLEECWNRLVGVYEGNNKNKEK